VIVNFGDLIHVIVVLIPSILLTLTMHEMAHALMAFLRGDPTAKLAGRLTFNPFRHLDFVGAIAFFITFLLGVGIGWGKPVPVDYRLLKNQRCDIMLISVIGPIINLINAFILAFLLHLLVVLEFFIDYSLWWHYLSEMFVMAVQLNVVLAFFNLLPLASLDGLGVIFGLLPSRVIVYYKIFNRYGFTILLVFIFLPQFFDFIPNFLRLLVVKPASFLAAWLLPS